MITKPPSRNPARHPKQLQPLLRRNRRTRLKIKGDQSWLIVRLKSLVAVEVDASLHSR